MITVVSFKGGYDDNFSYLVYNEDSQVAMIIDTALNPKEILDFAAEKRLTIKYAVVMHSHFDHTVKLEYYRKNNIPLVGSSQLPFPVDKKVDDNETITLGKTTFKIISAPGHTPDCILLYSDGKLFTTDVLFINSCGRCDLQGGDVEEMYETLYTKILTLPDDTIIYPGHDYGPVPYDTLENQKKTNHFLLARTRKEFLGVVHSGNS